MPRAHTYSPASAQATCIELPKGRDPHSVAQLVHDVSRLRRTVADLALRSLNVTSAQCRVLVTLVRRNGKGMLQTELAKVLEIGKGTLGGLVDRLEENGYARRIPEPGDRRANRIIATSEGQNMLRSIVRSRKAIDDKIMAGVSQQEREQAEAVLRVLKKRLIAMDAIPGSRKPGRR